MGGISEQKAAILEPVQTGEPPPAAGRFNVILPHTIPDAPGISPEAELLLGIAGVGDLGVRHNRIRALVEDGIRWEYLLFRAAQSRITSLLYSHLQQACPEAVPPGVMNRLRAEYQRNTMRNLYMTRELVEILKEFEKSGIAAIPYKGPVAAITVYKNLSVREFWDLDIIVRKNDVLRAKDLIVGRGYMPEKEMTREEERRFLESDSEYSLDRASDGSHVEIHWQVLPSPHARGLQPEDLWENLTEADLAGYRVRLPTPETRFAILCIHGGDKHQWSRLKWLADVAHLVEVYKDSFDWDHLMGYAEEIDRTRTIDLALYLSFVLLKAPVPREIIERIRADRTIGPMAGLIRGRLFREDRGLPGFEEWLRYMRAEGNANGKLSLLGRTQQFSRYVKALLTPCWDDQQALPLPQWLASLHYIMRPIRMVGIHKTGLLRRLR